MREQQIWPNGRRYLWTDAFGVLLSAYRQLGQKRYSGEVKWLVWQVDRSLAKLDRMWIDPPGYSCRAQWLPNVKFAFTNYRISLGCRRRAPP
jgi:hypothetical protein